MEVEGVDGGMEGRRKSKMIPGFVRVTGSNGTVNRNKDIRKRYCCVFEGEGEDRAFNFGNTKLEYHGTKEGNPANIWK